MITLYNVISSDGFIAAPGGSEDFIPDETWPKTLKFFQNYDSVVMGRKTYEEIQSYQKKLLEPFEALQCLKVIVTRDRDFRPKAGYVIVNSAEEISALGKNILVTSGPTLNNYLLEHGLVDEIIFYRLDVKIGNGIKPYDMTPRVPIRYI